MCWQIYSHKNWIKKKRKSALLKVILFYFFNCNQFLLILAYFFSEVIILIIFLLKILRPFLFIYFLMKDLEFLRILLKLSSPSGMFCDIIFFKYNHQFVFASHKLIRLVAKVLHSSFYKKFMLRGLFFSLVNFSLQFSLYYVAYLR